ncbi:MAG: hypothetical protein JWO36_7118 [Myxococcales bacterium]|nr:hypothetical protein [Myxococcales bacterium]
MRSTRLLPAIILFVACGNNGATPDAHIIVGDSSTTIDAPGLNLVDSYMDRDTFQFTTGATTNQLSLRLNWPGNTADMDYLVFPANKTGDIGGGTAIGTMEDEFTTLAVKPSTPYWLWVGQYSPSGPPAAVAYDATICGETYAAGTQTCQYTEMSDATNDYNATPAGTFEATGLTSTAVVVCGTINNGHFNTNAMSVDIDSYQFRTTAAADVMMTFTAPGAAALDAVYFFLWDITANQSVGIGGRFVGDHGVSIGNLPAGNYEIDIEAYAPADIAAGLPYKVKIAVDTPATRCTKSTMTASYTEANDGADNKGNDMIQIDYNAMTPTPTNTLTTSTTDMAEPTGLTVAPATTYRITGNSALIQ